MIPKSLAVLGAVIATVAACGGESARANTPVDLTGTYTYVGADTTGKIPWAARAELTLRGDSTFHFELRVRVKDEDQQGTKAGRYRVQGDRLLLTAGDRDHDSFELLVRGDSLIMDAGWVAMAALRMIGVPRPVLVKGR
jgi:hypothetical protein